MRKWTNTATATATALTAAILAGGCGNDAPATDKGKMDGKMQGKMDGKMGDKMDGKMGDKM